MTNRREWLQKLGIAGLSGAATGGVSSAQSAPAKPLALADYQPVSMLHVSETAVERARYPVIDIHTHLSWSADVQKGIELSGERKFLANPSELLTVMDRRNLRTLTNLTGGYGKGVEEAIRKFDQAHPGRFYTFTNPVYSRFKEPNYPAIQAESIEAAHRAGARGLKILKTLGLYLRENITSGSLVKIDDPRFDPMWDACAQLNMPVAIHVSDPLAFFTPTDRFNERYEELSNHPDWSFYGNGFPSNAELIEARNRVIARHPKTRFIVLHVGNF